MSISGALVITQVYAAAPCIVAPGRNIALNVEYMKLIANVAVNMGFQDGHIKNMLLNIRKGIKDDSFCHIYFFSFVGNVWDKILYRIVRT